MACRSRPHGMPTRIAGLRSKANRGQIRRDNIRVREERNSRGETMPLIRAWFGPRYRLDWRRWNGVDERSANQDLADEPRRGRMTTRWDSTSIARHGRGDEVGGQLFVRASTPRDRSPQRSGRERAGNGGGISNPACGITTRLPDNEAGPNGGLTRRRRPRGWPRNGAAA